MADRYQEAELGECCTPVSTSPTINSRQRKCLSSVRSIIPSWESKRPQDFAKTEHDTQKGLQIEDYPDGYPRFSALIASHDSFYICRRFAKLRSRLLLIKQDELSMLEQKLEKVDREEDKPLRLGSRRRDDNTERQSILSSIDKALADYDAFVERNHRMFGRETASTRNVSNLRNWADGNGCIARSETKYLAHSEELISVADTDDTVMTWLETLVENGLHLIRRYIHREGCLGYSRDVNVYIPIKSHIARLARILMTPFIITLLLAPVIICYRLTLMSARICIIVISTTVFIAVLSWTTRAKTSELVVAGATYTTVLTVFISNADSLAG